MEKLKKDHLFHVCLGAASENSFPDAWRYKIYKGYFLNSILEIGELEVNKSHFLEPVSNAN